MTDMAALDELIEAITVDGHDAEEQMMGFHNAFSNDVSLPIEIVVLGVPVHVVDFGIREDDTELTALCRRGDAEHELSLAELVFEPQSVVGWIHAAYRRCLGLRPCPAEQPPGWELSD